MSVPVNCIRNAARALLIERGRILLLRKEGGRFALPGGAQELGETLQQALQRECREEIGSRVEVLRLLHVADWFKPREGRPPATRQLLEFLFLCRLPADYQAHNGPRPDKRQLAVEWLPLDRLPEDALQPAGLLALIRGQAVAEHPVYLGRLD
ncbi:NUDIX domain-containing protein [Magnetovirga frankeli]|uniref:NUDIX domain-containing protein n=1 Tax=Magnetovirga frankeli TaxID=947516 RepID=UPI001AF2045C|nr:NUDIX domain-containing protein [gamma proteobacterium SS-5]